jgi:hypothetical protein
VRIAINANIPGSIKENANENNSSALAELFGRSQHRFGHKTMGDREQTISTLLMMMFV